MLSLRTVLCAIDFSDGSSRALTVAADLAERTHADLHLLHVDPLFRARLAQVPGMFRQRVEAFVNQTLGADDAFEVLAPALHESCGETPSDGILNYAESIDADLIVTSTHGRRGLEHLILGSVAAEVLRLAPVPVLVVPAQADPLIPAKERPVLVAMDVSALSKTALRVADQFADAYGVPITLAHVRNAPPDTLIGPPAVPGRPHTGLPSREEAHAALQQIIEEAELASAPETFVVAGSPGAELVALADRIEARAIVMGTHGRSGWERFRLGSVAEWVVRHATCPVLTVPAAAMYEPSEAETSASADAS